MHGDKLDQNSFGEVRLGRDLITKLTHGKDIHVAIRFEHSSDTKQHLWTEYKVYSKLTNTNEKIGFLNIYWFGIYGDYDCLIMDRFGQSLKTLHAKCHRIFCVQTVALIDIQILDRLQVLHDHGLLHQDIKPENIVIGYGDSSTLYLIDYGTSDQYIDPQTNINIVIVSNQQEL